MNQNNSKNMNQRKELIGSASLALFSAILLGCGNEKTNQQNNEKKDENRRPNILIAISDDQSYPHCSAYGDKAIQTPAFDRIAQNGILFTNCIAPSPGSAPSRSALLTGRYPWQNEQAGQHSSSYPQKYVVYPDVLEKNGYFIGYTGKGCAPFNWKISGRERNPAGIAYNEIVYSDTTAEKPPTDYINKINYSANFKAFIDKWDKKQPFYFWYGATEPHRAYEKGSGRRLGKNPEKVKVPKFLPDSTEIRNDMLDYAVEIEWFEKHLMQMIDYLEKTGELENTLIIVTSDNGMPFPRAKANCYEYGIHVPLAISYPKKIPANRIVDDLISFTDFAPTLFEFAGIEPSQMLPITGKSIVDILTSKKSGIIDPKRKAVFSTRERHSSSRWNNLGYPIRAMRTHKFLFIRNFRPERWPAGAPQMRKEDGSLDKMHGRFNENVGYYDFAYTDIDGCWSKDYLIMNRNDENIRTFFDYAVAKRPEIELYDITKDPACLYNLAEQTDYQDTVNELNQQMEAFLTKTGDPRLTGENPDIFETYKRYSHIRDFPKPDWAKSK